MAVVIGIDPHKQTHQAVAVDSTESELARLEVRAPKRQVDQLVRWAAPFPERTWAIESAGGLGYLLAQQLVDAGEHVVDVPATLASRVRLLGSGRSNKNDPNDAHSVAVAALRLPGLATVMAADHRVVLRILVKLNVDLARERNRIGNRLHALLSELVAAGITKEIRASAAQAILDDVVPMSPAASARQAMAFELLEDVRRLDGQLAESKRRIAEAVTASKTTLTDVFGGGRSSPRCASDSPATCAGSRLPIASSHTPAPHRSRSPPAATRCSVESPREPPVEPRHPHGRRDPTPPHPQSRPRLLRRKISEGKSPKMALRSLKRRISDVIYRHLLADADHLG